MSQSENPQEESEEHDDHDHFHSDRPNTHNPNVRAKWLSTVIAVPIALHYPILVIGAAMGLLDIGAITQPWFVFDTIGWLTVMTYIFGKKTVEAARAAFGK